MEIRKVSVSDMFGWLIGSFKLVGKHWGTFMLASLIGLVVILLVMALIMTVIIGLGAAGAVSMDAIGIDMDSMDWQKNVLLYAAILLYAGGLSLALILVSPLIAGWFVLTGKLANGPQASVSDLFTNYGDGTRWKKLITFAFTGTLFYIVALGSYILFCVALGFGSDDLVQLINVQQNKNPEGMVALSAGFWLAYVGFYLINYLLQKALILGFCQAALTAGSALDSVKDGIAATLKNLSSLLLFWLVMQIATALILVLLMALIMLLMAQSNAQAIVIWTLLIFILLFFNPLWFSFQYLFWRDVLGGGGKSAAVNDSEVLI